MSPLPGCESSKLYLWCPHPGVALPFRKTFSSAAVLSDESAPTFPPLHLLPLLSPQSHISTAGFLSFIPKSTTCSASRFLVWPTLQPSDSFPVSGTWPGPPFLSPLSQGIWHESSVLRCTSQALCDGSHVPVQKDTAFAQALQAFCARAVGVSCGSAACGLACPLGACQCPAWTLAPP